MLLAQHFCYSIYQNIGGKIWAITITISVLITNFISSCILISVNITFYKIKCNNLWLISWVWMLLLKIFFENVLFCCILAFILNALEKDKILSLIIYFAVSYLATKHNKSKWYDYSLFMFLSFYLQVYRFAFHNKVCHEKVVSLL